MKTCINHPESLVLARGMCKSCYSKWLLASNPEYRKAQIENRKTWGLKNPDKILELRRRRNIKEKTDPVGIKQRRNKTLRKYGLTSDSYNLLLEQQDRVCYLCKRVHLSGRKLHVDHNHDTGVVRSLLCAQCNWFVGKIDRDINVLQKLINYEEVWKRRLLDLTRGSLVGG